MATTEPREAPDAPEAAESRETCPGCYSAVGGVEACYRWHWHAQCPCGRCEARRANASLEDDPGDMGEPPIAVQRQEAAIQGNLRQVLHRDTLVVCDYDAQRTKHSRCGDRLTERYAWLKPGAIVEGDVTYCPACSRRTALKAEVKVQPCTSCGALMYWGVGARGGKMPISIKTGESHFRDCPYAAKHSKRSRA
jgi:hypothetical protein